MHLRRIHSSTLDHLNSSAAHLPLCWTSPIPLTIRQALYRPQNLSNICNREGKATLAMSNTLDVHKQLLRSSVPHLSTETYKGQAGKIAVIGGSLEYTGAPYFAAISTMRAGAELAFVYTTPEAAPAIKSYSPDLIVYPGFSFLGDDCSALNKMHAIVLGPGLGRGQDAATIVEKVVQYACECCKPLVIDADALFFLAQSAVLRKIIQDADCLICLTPNAVEMQRLQTALNVSSVDQVVSFFQGGVVIVQKGPTDHVVRRGETAAVCVEGSLKRVGGQGDFLAGVCALFCSWVARKGGSEADLASAAVCACIVTRCAANKAFIRFGRGLIASDICAFLAEQVDALFEKKILTE